MTVPVLRARGLTRRLSTGGRTLTVLDRVDLDIEASESVAILGPSGSGKSTLLGLLAGLDRPSEGTIELDGVALGGLDEDGLARLRRDKVGFVFQSFQLFGNLTARENVRLPLELVGHAGASEPSSRACKRPSSPSLAHALTPKAPRPHPRTPRAAPRAF